MRIYISKETARNINWIKKGQFSPASDGSDKAYYVVKTVELRETKITSDMEAVNKNYPYIKKEVCDKLTIDSLTFDALLWKLGLFNKKGYHQYSKYGKNSTHKCSQQCVEELTEGKTG